MSEPIKPYAPAIIKLLQGVVYHDDEAVWNQVLFHQAAIRDYFAAIGLALRLYEGEGFAFLSQPEPDPAEQQALKLPRLTRRYQLSREITLLGVLLRERLDQFDASTPESDRLLLESEELYAMLRPFYQEQSNEVAYQKRIDGLCKQAEELGFVRKRTIGENEYWEVRRILKARFDADTLSAIKETLEQYANDD